MPRIEDASRIPTSDRLAPFAPREARIAAAPADEELIVDDRCSMRPAQMVEEKLARVLKDSMVPVSHLLLRKLIRAR